MTTIALLTAREEERRHRSVWSDVFGGTTRSLVVTAELSDGRTGTGEATLLPGWSGEWSASSILLLTDVLSPALVGLTAGVKDAFRARAALGANGFLIWAVEAAILDALGHRGRSGTVPIRGLIGRVCPQTAEALAAEQTATGYGRLKVKLAGDRREDEERLHAVRRAAPKATIVADANESLSFDDLPVYGRLFRRLEISGVEQPCSRIDVLERGLPEPDGWIWVADESIWGYDDALALRDGPWQAWTLHPGKCRGEDVLEHVSALATELGIGVVLGSNGEFGPGSEALCRLASELPRSTVQEELGHDMAGPLLAEGWASPSLTLVDGAIHRREEA